MLAPLKPKPVRPSDLSQTGPFHGTLDDFLQADVIAAVSASVSRQYAADAPRPPRPTVSPPPIPTPGSAVMSAEVPVAMVDPPAPSTMTSTAPGASYPGGSGSNLRALVSDLPLPPTLSSLAAAGATVGGSAPPRMSRDSTSRDAPANASEVALANSLLGRFQISRSRASREANLDNAWALHWWMRGDGLHRHAVKTSGRKFMEWVYANEHKSYEQFHSESNMASLTKCAPPSAKGAGSATDGCATTAGKRKQASSSSSTSTKAPVVSAVVVVESGESTASKTRKVMATATTVVG